MTSENVKRISYCVMRVAYFDPGARSNSTAEHAEIAEKFRVNLGGRPYPTRCGALVARQASAISAVEKIVLAGESHFDLRNRFIRNLSVADLFQEFQHDLIELRRLLHVQAMRRAGNDGFLPGKR
jgi:hypothetical protein